MPNMPATPVLSPLPYESLLELRPRDRIDLVVIHCTELPDLASARSYGEQVLYDSGTGNSGHFYIDRDGSVHQYVSVERVAHHVRDFVPQHQTQRAPALLTGCTELFKAVQQRR